MNKQVTNVYIDAANIRFSLAKSNVHIDFVQTYDWLITKFGKQTTIKFYEGLAINDIKREKRHARMIKKGFEVVAIKRMQYITPTKYQKFNCKSCQHSNEVLVQSSRKVMKSNCDVALAVDAMFDASFGNVNKMIFLASDGDYAHLFVKLIECGIKIEVWAPYSSKHNRSTSTKITELSNIYRDHFKFNNILNIKDFISKKKTTAPKWSGRLKAN